MIFIKNGGEKIEVTHYCRMKVERKMLKTQVKVILIAEIFFFNFILSVEFATKAWNFNNGVWRIEKMKDAKTNLSSNRSRKT